ncbi:MAG: hypothetical protein ACJAQ2_000578, partial [Vicingaceae bacterium]
YKTNRNFYLTSMIMFISFSFEFFIRSDNFSGGVLMFNGAINLLAFNQVPRKIAAVTVILNLFNALISLTICYNYSVLDYSYLYVFWMLTGAVYLIATIRQTINLIRSASYKRKMKRRND